MEVSSSCVLRCQSRRAIALRDTRGGAGMTRRRAAFTLVELLLVLAIVVMAVGVAIPHVANSLRGAKLRQASRDIIALNRYARKTAVIHQRHVVLLYDTNNRRIELVPMSSPGFQGGGVDPFTALSGVSDAEEVRELGASEAEFSMITSQMRTRRLPEGIDLLDFTFPGMSLTQQEDGVYWVTYYPNGMCDAVAFAVQDSRRHRVDITIDAITGEIRTRQNW